MIKNVDDVLLCQMSDGKFFWLIDHGHSSSWGLTDNPEEAYRKKPWNAEDLKSPKPAYYYFENSSRARYIWTKDSKMVAYRITTTVEVEKL